ncbi:MAG: acyl-CoA thioesterase, partial [Actinomycetota bacterium]
MTYTHRIRVRYGECDMQRVVFNANYFAYCDDAVDSWMRQALSMEMKTSDPVTDLHTLGFDFMLKSATMTWHAPVRFAEFLDLVADPTVDPHVETACSPAGHLRAEIQ